ncbi:helix-turn-helix transcriptional regulator [Mesorhizobium sp. ZC-5]|uniref:helix-turn-helix transcriptional regulator n=1 Tax=Mesorhizobium sp. ZC-5 TaxID=2986066 RepID=UPI0021E914B5|nr:AlpA family transcriptional regulator [Mesorhizobium sp. ZC-5]MCV3239669.1 AlpA family transcriptional regulator [Mesorhizobium sp. ZC-5]
MTDIFLRREEVEKAVGLKHSSLYALIAEGKFPKPVPLGAKSVRWSAAEILDWQKARIAERDGVAA